MPAPPDQTGRSRVAQIKAAIEMADYPSQPASNAFDYAHGFPPPLGFVTWKGKQRGFIWDVPVGRSCSVSKVSADGDETLTLEVTRLRKWTKPV